MFCSCTWTLNSSNYNVIKGLLFTNYIAITTNTIIIISISLWLTYTFHCYYNIFLQQIVTIIFPKTLFKNYGQCDDAIRSKYWIFMKNSVICLVSAVVVIVNFELTFG